MGTDFVLVVKCEHIRQTGLIPDDGSACLQYLTCMWYRILQIFVFIIILDMAYYSHVGVCLRLFLSHTACILVQTDVSYREGHNK